MDEQQRTERRLAAILAADVAGYSRLMSRDEEGTLQRLKGHLGELIEPHIAAHRGRIVKRTGDGLLVDFASAVEAVRCAVAIQAGMADRNRGAPDEARIEFRIGINLGDVIIEGEDIYGDGVNIAARLEGLAEPGAIFVSRAVRDSVRDKLGVELEDLGERPVKNIARPVRVFRIGRANGAARPAAPAVPDKPSIAVLPFANMSGDAEQEYFSDGISEDLITDLSKVQALFVIARNSSFTYKGRSVKVQEIGRELGVRFVLEGSIRKAGNRVRITAQLVDAQSGGHLWADRFDRELTDIFATQDEVVHKIVEALAVKLSRVEEQDLKRGGTKNLEAYESWLRARQLLGIGTRETIAEAKALHRRALELDPNFVGTACRLGLRVGVGLRQRLDPRRTKRSRRGRALGAARHRARRTPARRPCRHGQCAGLAAPPRRCADRAPPGRRARPQLRAGPRAPGHGPDVLGPSARRRWSRSPWRCGSIRSIPTSCCI